MARARAATATPLATLIHHPRGASAQPASSTDPLLATCPQVRARHPCGARETIPDSFTSRYNPGVFAPGSGRKDELLHPERAARRAGQELADEHVVRVEQLLGGAGLD